MSEEKIQCAICGAAVHVIANHLKTHHPEVTLPEYQRQHPTAPIVSQKAKDLMEEMTKKQAASTPAAAAPAVQVAAAPVAKTDYVGAAAYRSKKQALHEVFGLGNVKAALSSKGNPIPITTMESVGSSEMIPRMDPGYIFDIDELKNLMLGVEMNMAVYIYGHKGAGKTELAEQMCARTGRPAIRLQHTINTEEAHVVGMWTVKEGETVFNFGPLALAMMNGWLYIADEYDFALPSVTSVYQAVLEGKALYIKEAPADQRLIKPHPNFRFIATGNTNGSGDESGLYQGTNVQNSANYDRFGIMIHKQYMPAEAEQKIIQNRTGLKEDEAKKVVEFAGMVRKAYNDNKISDTVSPRTLINAAKIGIARGNFTQGLQLSFINKLSTVDRKVVTDLAQRVFG
jgi:cobaltochelatase CobS